MIVRSLSDLENTDRETRAETWVSRRFLLKSDGMGFSLHDTIIHAGTTTEMHYRNHLEAVYCIEGKGVLKDDHAALTWLTNVNEIIAYASRAFALYYMLQCIVAFFVAHQMQGLKNRSFHLIRFVGVAIACLLVFMLGVPSG